LTLHAVAANLWSEQIADFATAKHRHADQKRPNNRTIGERPGSREDRAMKFGIFYELQLPRPWTADSEYQLFQDALSQFELADKLGYDHAWVVEHHFLEEYSHSSAPEVFLGAASQRTKNIRLGHGVIQITTNQPQRVAERVSTLDLLSGGRVEFGMGEATGPAELHPFGTRVRDKRDRWEEAVRAILPMFTKEDWEFHGQYHDFPARNVIPKSRQKPHPPLWVACSNIQTIAKAGEWGMGALGFTFVSPEAARAWVHRYYNNFLHNANRLTEYKDNPNIAVVSGFMCAPTDEEARELAAGWTFFIFALGYYGRAGVDAPGKSDLWSAYQAWRGSDKAKAALDNALVGSPETLRKKLHQFAESRVDQVILLNQAGKTTHKAICDSLELFAKDVMPEFHALEPDHQRWKNEVLAGRIVLENIATDGYDIYAHQEPGQQRETPEEFKRRMMEKDKAKATAAAK
jgi:luciferase family oxidoreductase group 1